jgi:hypothetical protein
MDSQSASILQMTGGQARPPGEPGEVLVIGELATAG